MAQTKFDVERMIRAIEEAKEVTRELHGTLKDGRELLREMKSHMLPSPDMLGYINVAIDKHVGEQAVRELEELQKQVLRASHSIERHFDRMMEALTGGKMADLESLTELIERTAEEDPLKAKMALLMASRYADIAKEKIAIIDLRE